MQTNITGGRIFVASLVYSLLKANISMMPTHIGSCLIAVAALLTMAGCSSGTSPVPQVGTIRGTVTNALTGQPIAQAGVRTTPPSSSVLTDAAGAFTMGDVPVGTYLVQAERADVGSGTAQVAVTAGATTTAAIALNTSFTRGAITGYVRNKATQDPVNGAVIDLLGLDRSTTTDSTGLFRVDSLEAAFITVRASKKGFIYAEQRVQVAAGLTAVTDVFGLESLFPAVTDGLVAFFPLDGTDEEISGSGQITKTTMSNTQPAANRKGNADRAMRFTADTDSYVQATTGPGFAQLPVTVAFWMLREAPSAELESVVSKYLHPSGEGVVIMHEGATLVSLYSTETFSNYCRIDQPAPGMDAWVHVAFVCTETIASLYVNGELLDTDDWRGTPMPTTSSEPLRIGAMRSTATPALRPRGFHGVIDDVAWYGRALSPQEIKTLADDK